MKIKVKVINIICMVMFVVSLAGITTTLLGYKKSEQVYANLKTNTSAFENLENELKSKNPDYRFWLKVENTNIDYPVVQSEDNEYYLKKNINNEDDISGSVFVDFRNNSNNDKNTVIYAHYMRNKTMFGELANFKDEEFFKQNNKITILKGSNEYTYEVFSSYVTNTRFNYIETSFDTKEEYSNFLDSIIAKSTFKSDVEVNEDDMIITLSTCSYEFKGARMVVHAKLQK